MRKMSYLLVLIVCVLNTGGSNFCWKGIYFWWSLLIERASVYQYATPVQFSIAWTNKVNPTVPYFNEFPSYLMSNWHFSNTGEKYHPKEAIIPQCIQVNPFLITKFSAPSELNCISIKFWWKIFDCWTEPCSPAERTEENCSSNVRCQFRAREQWLDERRPAESHWRALYWFN